MLLMTLLEKDNLHMKNRLNLTLTLITFVMFTLVSNSFAQDTSPLYVVRQIYFYPSDLQLSQDTDATLDKLVGRVQQFYADEMERHGFGRKTFRLETNELGEPVRHYVRGKFDNDYYNLSRFNPNSFEVFEEIKEHFNLSEHFINLVFLAHNSGRDSDIFLPVGGEVSGRGGGHSFGGLAHINLIDFHLLDFEANELLNLKVFNTIAHELGHAFGLPHDFRDDRYMMSYGPEDKKDRISFCAAEWLDASRYFNDSQNSFAQVPTINMLEPSFISPPNTIRLRFEIIHSARLHQALLLTNSLYLPERVDQIALLHCKSLNASNTTIEFNTTELTPESRYVSLHVIDVHGNFSNSDRFSIDIASLVPGSEPVLIPEDIPPVVPNPDPISIPDPHLQTLIRDTLNLSPESPITKLDMFGLKRLYVPSPNPEKQITDLAGLQYATQLFLIIIHPASDSAIRDISPLAGLTQLTNLGLWGNQISDISPLARLNKLWSVSLGSNQISDISPLANLVSLRQLLLASNTITDVRPLAKLIYLFNLDLSRNQISDIRPLATLERLQTLVLRDNKISDISPLAELTQLTHLYLNNNQIKDVTPLENLVNLRELRLTGNPIKNRKPLLALLRKNPDVKIYLKNNLEPLPVTLSHFRAEHTKAGVVLQWTTESEVDNAGFYIYRSETKDGEFRPINSTMIQGAGTTGERNEYTWTDTTAKPNTVYYYRIKDISHAGVREQLATVRLRGFVSARGRLTTMWGDLKK